MSIRNRVARGAPEHNKVQAPELLRRLTRLLGLRQMHVAPSLTEGVTPVVVLGDVSERPSEHLAERIYGFSVFAITDATNTRAGIYLVNPPGTPVDVELHRLAFYATTTAGAPAPVEVGIGSLTPTTSAGSAPVVPLDQSKLPDLTISVPSFARVQTVVGTTFQGNAQFGRRQTLGDAHEVNFKRAVFPPNTGLTVATFNPAGAMVFAVMFEWTERNRGQ